MVLVGIIGSVHLVAGDIQLKTRQRYSPLDVAMLLAATQMAPSNFLTAFTSLRMSSMSTKLSPVCGCENARALLRHCYVMSASFVIADHSVPISHLG